MNTHLLNSTIKGIIASDKVSSTMLKGQYAQRTHNYRPQYMKITKLQKMFSEFK